MNLSVRDVPDLSVNICRKCGNVFVEGFPSSIRDQFSMYLYLKIIYNDKKNNISELSDKYLVISNSCRMFNPAIFFPEVSGTSLMPGLDHA